MTDPRHNPLHEIVKKLPSDFQPYGQRSRDDDWGPDCSCGCRWFIPLGADLQFDWGACYNPRSPRRGLLTFEHQGCREFEGEEQALEEAGSSEESPGQKDRPAEAALLRNIRLKEGELKALLEKSNDH